MKSLLPSMVVLPLLLLMTPAEPPPSPAVVALAAPVPPPKAGPKLAHRIDLYQVRAKTDVAGTRYYELGREIDTRPGQVAVVSKSSSYYLRAFPVETAAGKTYQLKVEALHGNQAYELGTAKFIATTYTAGGCPVMVPIYPSGSKQSGAGQLRVTLFEGGRACSAYVRAVRIDEPR